MFENFFNIRMVENGATKNILVTILAPNFKKIDNLVPKFPKLFFYNFVPECF